MDPKVLKKKAVEALTMGFNVIEIATDLNVTEAEIIAVLPPAWKRQIFAAKVEAPAEGLTPYEGAVHAYPHFALPERGDVGLGGDEAPAQSSYGSRNWCEHCGSSAGCDCRVRLGLPARPVRTFVPRGDRGTGL